MITLKNAPQNSEQLLQQALSLYQSILWRTLPFSLLGACGIFFPQLINQILIQLNYTQPCSHLALYAISLVASLVFLAALNVKIYGEYHQITTTFRHVMKQAFLKFIPLLLLMVVYLLIVVSGTMLLIIPGILLSISLMFSFLLLIIDNKNILQALMTSHQLVWGNWWHTCLVISIPILLDFVFSFSVLVALIALAATKSFSFIMLVLLITLMNIIIHTLVIPLIFCIAFVLLHDLQQRQVSS